MKSSICLFIVVILIVNCIAKHEETKAKKNGSHKNQVSQNINRLASRSDQNNNKKIKTSNQKYSKRNHDPKYEVHEIQESYKNSENVTQEENEVDRRVTDPEYENKFPSNMARLKAEITRLLLRTGDGAAVSTRFTAQSFTRYTYVKMQLIADIPNDDRYAGIPYFLMNRNDITVRDLRVDNRGSFLLSQAMNDERHHECDPWPMKSEDVKCHKATFIGDFVDIQSTSEINFALQQFEARYYLKRTDLDNYFVSKMNIKAIYIGEGEPLPLNDYYNARPYGWNLLTDQGDGPSVFPDFEVFTEPSTKKTRRIK